MKKSIHIAGFTIGVIAVYTLTVACVLALAQKPPQKVYSKGSDWEDCKALAGPEGLQCRVLPNGRDIEVRSVASDSDCKPPSCLPVSTDPVCSVGSEFVPCPPKKVQIANCDPVIQVTGTVEFPCPLKPGETVNFTVCAEPDGKAVACPPNARRESNPAPFDVPAISSVHEIESSPNVYQNLQRVWTCANKSRFLLFSEDGKAHCLKLVSHE